jgi:uncharacterized protein (DUF1501 family)
MAFQNMDRRRLLRMGGALSVLGVGAPFALQLAAAGAAAGAGTTPDYKALVCVFLYGGNDANNMVLATDTDSWGRYTSARNTGADPIALQSLGAAATMGAKLTTPQAWGGVIPITPDTPQPIPAGTNASVRTFALHPFMTGAQSLFNAGRLAVVANVGTLIQPTTKAQYVAQSVALPPSLYSHANQQAEWQAGTNQSLRIGWGGQMADYVTSQNGTNTVFTAISPSGNAVFLAGQTVVQYVVSTGSPPAILISGDQGTSLFGSSAGPTNLAAVVQDTSGTSDFASDYSAIINRSISAAGTLNGAFAQAPANGIAPPPTYANPLNGTTETNSLALQLHTVAQMVAAAPGLGVKRQVFFVSMGGFDNHQNQNENQPDLLKQLSDALAYFDNALTSVGGVDRSAQVTTFTASDFSRTWTTNGSGTDHAWGAHHLVVGGAVKGQNIYGQFPTVGIDLGSFTNPDMSGNAIIPTTSVDQYGAVLGAWFGVPAGTLSTIFPNLGNFPAVTNLGFV